MNIEKFVTKCGCIILITDELPYTDGHSEWAWQKGLRALTVTFKCWEHQQ